MGNLLEILKGLCGDFAGQSCQKNRKTSDGRSRCWATPSGAYPRKSELRRTAGAIRLIRGCKKKKGTPALPRENPKVRCWLQPFCVMSATGKEQKGCAETIAFEGRGRMVGR